MAEREGNVLRPPGTTQRGPVGGEEIMAAYSPPPLIKGITIPSGEGVLEAGTVMGRVTASKKYVAYDDTAVDGSQVARGILRNSIDCTDADGLGDLVMSGIVKLSKIIGLDAAATTDLNARSDTDRDYYIF